MAYRASIHYKKATFISDYVNIKVNFRAKKITMDKEKH